MLQRSILFLFLTSLWICPAARADVGLVYNSGGVDHFRIQIPDGWKVNVGIEPDPGARTEQGWILPRLVTAMPDDAMPLWFAFWVPPDVATIGRAKPYMDSLAPVLLDNVEVAQRTTGRLNGMPSLHVRGTGYKEDELMDFDALFVQLTDHTLAIAIYIGPHEATIRYGEDLQKLIGSLQPVQQPEEVRP